MRQRKKEVDALVELLEQEHPDVEALASDIWKMIDGFRRDRDLYVIATRLAGGVNLLFGPYESEALAQKDIDKSIVRGVTAGDKYMLMRIISPNSVFESSEPTLFDVR